MSDTQTTDEVCCGIRILLVDDHDTNQLVAQQYLQREGYEVDTAADGRQAADAFQNRRYDLILMDIEMPVMDGYEATRIIRNAEAEDRRHKTEDSGQNAEDPSSSHPQRDFAAASAMRNKKDENSDTNIQRSATRDQRPVPIIAMSGHSTAGFSDDCRKAGISDSIGKPLQREALLTMVQKWTTNGSKPKGARQESKVHGISGRGPANDQFPIDLDGAVREFMGEREILANVLQKFIQRSRAQIDTTRAHIVRQDMQQVASEAHAIKGGAANLLAIRLSEIAAELENAAEHKSSGKTTRLVDRLEDELNHLAIFVQHNGLHPFSGNHYEDLNR
jgi:CheY-like chemotaxis protein/HPt (histidine-containing phosphotransfer) domain-containing protein